jgi:hypothetical protein
VREFSIRGVWVGFGKFSTLAKFIATTLFVDNDRDDFMKFCS